MDQNRLDNNLKAMDKMSELHNALRDCGYKGRELEVFLVRLLFCLFADDTDIFPQKAFFTAVLSDDVSLVSENLSRLFRTLDTPEQERTSAEGIGKLFPYINGQLFTEVLPVYPLNPEFCQILKSCENLAWGQISPAIFGAMFQEIMNQQTRREWGTYYTSEENIGKLIRPLFLDQLWEEFRSCKSRRELGRFHDKLASLTFLDPACGCGNFLIVTYQEIRKLELEVIRALYDTHQRVLDVGMYCRVNVSQFYGIEYEPFQAQIARLGMWLADHKLNREAAEYFGMYYARIPLVQSPHIHQGNALTVDWNQVISKEKLDYIIGNPPFVGARLMNEEQKKDMRRVFGLSKTAGNLDYVAAWYRKAAAYMAGTSIRAAFVSTNSISQGEQASILWKNLKYNYHTGIDFARRTFVWNNEAGGAAKVHCVMIGFSDWSITHGENRKKRLFEGDREFSVGHINAYLFPAKDVFVEPRRQPLSEGIPAMSFGSMANDGGHLILSAAEAATLIDNYPVIQSAVRPLIGSEEYINGKERYCLWLLGIHPDLYENIPEVQERIYAVHRFREYSPREATRKLAKFSSLFGEIRQPEEGKYILIPRVSSWRRSYIPMGFLTADTIASDAALLVPGATEELFGILTSAMHMAWVRAIAGRLKSDYRYSASIVYNNFPFPELTPKARDEIAQKAMLVLETRDLYVGKTLADLYDDRLMPEELKLAHKELDRAVDQAYGREFHSEEERVIFLMDRYAKITGSL